MLKGRFINDLFQILLIDICPCNLFSGAFHLIPQTFKSDRVSLIMNNNLVV